MNVQTVATPQQWHKYMAARRGHLLQSWAWGELKGRFGWRPQRVRVGDGAAQLLVRRLPLGATIAYLPKGPLVDWSDQARCRALLAALHAEARRRRAIFLKIEPDVLETARQASQAGAVLQEAGFRPADPIQPRTSQVIDISEDEAAILAAMKQKTRYNIRLAGRKGVSSRIGAAGDVTTFYELAQLTASRDGFGIHSLDYYQTAYRLFAPDRCALLLAEYQDEALAALMLFRQGRQAYYFYGASANHHRNLMPAYLLQWRAIQWAKEQGCAGYDLWGLPDADPATLEAEFKHRRDGLWGVYRFKRGFGGQVVRSIGAFDYVYNPLLYRLYRWYRARRPGEQEAEPLD